MAISKAILANAASLAFSALGDIKETCTYRVTSSTYNVTTGINAQTQTDYTIDAVFTKYKNFQIE